MSKAYKPVNPKYIDSTGIVHNKVPLNTVIEDFNAKIVSINTHLNGLIKVVDYTTPKTSWSIGSRYKGNVTLSLPSGYQIISIIPCYVSYGDANFASFDLYHEIPRIYYEVYCQYSEGKANCKIEFRVVMIKNNLA